MSVIGISMLKSHHEKRFGSVIDIDSHNDDVTTQEKASVNYIYVLSWVFNQYYAVYYSKTHTYCRVSK